MATSSPKHARARHLRTLPSCLFDRTRAGIADLGNDRRLRSRRLSGATVAIRRLTDVSVSLDASPSSEFVEAEFESRFPVSHGAVGRRPRPQSVVGQAE